MKQLKKKSSKVVAFLLAIAMVATSLAYTPNSASAASKKVSSVKITKPSTKVLVLKKGKTYKMKVKVTAKKSKYKKVTYKSSKKKVATVSKSGKIKALKKKYGDENNEGLWRFILHSDLERTIYNPLDVVISKWANLELQRDLLDKGYIGFNVTKETRQLNYIKFA